MAATTKPNMLVRPDGGARLADANTIELAIINSNGASSTYGITAAGTTQATATQLGSVYNQVDTVASSTGVNLPLSTGTNNTACQHCVIVNNGTNALNVYGAKGSSDTINGVAGSTAFLQTAGSLVVYASVKGGAWFAEGSNTVFATAQMGTVTLTGTTAVTVNNTNITASSQVLFTLKTVGGTVGAYPVIKTITVGTGFTVAGTAADTSTYNYAIID